MKYALFILPLLALTVSCGTSKKATDGNSSASNETTTEKPVDEDNTEVEKVETNGRGSQTMAEGVVKDMSADGCGFVIEVLIDNTTNESAYYEPLDLPKELQVEGTPIRCMYHLSRRASKCSSSIPIVIESIL